MAHRPRREMIAETRAKLVAAGRKAFGTIGYAQASMDDFTAEAGLTRGALYHHFGDKKGLFEAVVMQIDAEMTERLARVSAAAATPWDGFVEECVAYVGMALEPELQKILFRDGPAVLGDPSSWPNANGCIDSMTMSLEKARRSGTPIDVEPEAAARLLNGAMIHAAQWIANAPDQEQVSERAIAVLRALMEGLRRPVKTA